MKRYLQTALLCLLLFLLSSFKEASVFNHLPDYEAYNNLPVNYSLEEAKKDGCIVVEDSTLTSGADVLKLFTELEKSHQAGTMRIVTKLAEPNVMYILDLSFDGEYYSLTNYSVPEADRTIKIYKYFEHYFQDFPSESNYSQAELYILVNDKDVTLKDIEKSMAGVTRVCIDNYFVIYMLK